MLQAFHDFNGALAANIGQQQTLPRGKPQVAVAEVARQLCRASQHRRIKSPQRRYCADVDKICQRLWMSADVQNT
ncbi:hypothetical protein D3C87_1089500 [compost metagenome]